MTYPFRFKTLNYDFEERKHYTQTGMGFAASYSDAARILEERAKEELVAILNIELFEEDTVLLLPEEVCKLYAETEFPSLEWSITCDKDGNNI